jgi:hypothetical protein
VTTLTRADLLANARVKALRDAIVTRLKTRFVDLEVKAHLGKLDISDVLEKSSFNPPSIAVAATRTRPGVRLSGADDFVVDFTAYVVTDDLLVGGRRVERDEMALAICEALLIALSDDDFTRWGVENVSPPDDAEAKPLFTIKSMTQGVVYYAVTWKQTLYAVAPANFFTGDDA